ncbi:M56 family metallopeptidase [Parabacteroides sp. OttesenSCG-928-J18]|nr:M56 family metallopeptidase [Parabacteroides sp. OttesenSCG-928-J18]
MNVAWIYFLKINLAFSIFYLVYKLLFRNDTFFQLRRITLLAILLLAFIYPFPDLNGWISEKPVLNEFVVTYSSWLDTSQPAEQEIVYMPVLEANEVIAAEIPPARNWKEIGTMALSILYGIGVLLLLFRCLAEILSVVRTRRRCRQQVLADIRVYVSEDIEEPYSFFEWIFIDPKKYNNQTLREILLHEHTHVRQFHSFDIVLAECISVICWFNPFVWLLKKEIGINHEYIADQSVMRSGCNKKTYQYHLIGMEHDHPLAAANLYNYFSVLPLKKRIGMLNKKRTNRVRILKYLALIPIVAGLLILNNLDAMARMVTGESTKPVMTEEIREAASLETATHPILQQEDSIYTVVEVMPRFPGGDKELLNFITNNISYPEVAKEKGIQGRVVISYVVEKDGSITNLEVVRGQDPSLDKEAIRVMSTSPKWTPGQEKGITVRTKYTMPIQFRLGEKTDRALSAPSSESDVFRVAEKTAQFPGGERALLKYLSDNVKYPQIAKEKGIKGRVIVSFIVEKDGSVTNAEVLNGVDPSLDKEAIRVIGTFPKWTPAENDGKPVRIRYAMPIMFNL